MKTKQPNQITRDLLSVNSLNPMDPYDSSSRKQMFSSHIGQTLVIRGSTERRIQTGMEREYGKYTFSIKMPVDGTILRVIDRYREQYGLNAIAKNPQSIIIFEDSNQQIGMINITEYCSYHQYFGFQYQVKQALKELRTGMHVKGGTILLDSPSVTEDGGYKYGRECNMAFMSHPAVSEDGIMISRDVLPHFAFKTYENRVVEFGSKRFPLNLYGTVDNYKPFPDIGDYIRADGLLMCLRSYDENLSIVEQGPFDLMEPDFIYDKPTYVGAGGRVIDIRVHHDNESKQLGAPVGMETQAQKYDTARRQFYHDILAEYKRLQRQRGEALRITPEFHRMVVEACSVVGETEQAVQKLHRKTPLDDWRIEFVIQYDIIPTIGFKLTDCHGGKGVICHIANPEDMPVDSAGNRADIVMDPYSRISRMNIGGPMEQFANAASRDVTFKIRKDLGIAENARGVEVLLDEMEKANPEVMDRVWKYLLGYYNIVSPRTFVWMTSGEYTKTRAHHLANIVNHGVYLYWPTENEPEGETIVCDIQKHYRPTYGPVTYRGNSGRVVTTKDPVRIGSMYIILLEKTGDDWTAVSSGKLQHFGVLSQVTNADKNSQPTRQQAIRALGESEVRIYVSYAGAHITAEILDRNNNPFTHKQILYSILEADRPTDIHCAVDRNKIPLGGSKPLQLVKHIAECAGWKFVFQKHKPTLVVFTPPQLVQQ